MIIKGGRYKKLARKNRIREISISAARGKIFDRNGKVLAEDVVSWKDDQNNWISKDEALERMVKGEMVKVVLQRVYPSLEASAHLTGYLGRASSKEVGELRCPEKRLVYLSTDWVGRGGLEQEFDCLLAGREGKKMIELDSLGKLVREIGQVKAKKGNDLTTTIDIDLQNDVWDLIKDKKASVVIVKPNSGEVLSLVSSPSFNPNSFGVKANSEKISGWLGDKEGLPFLDRATSGSYHPGSVFKPVTSIAALQEGKIDAETEVEDTGFLKVGDWQYGNWYWLDYGRKEGMVNLVKALKRSNDIYFYKIGEWTGPDNIAKWARIFGYGQKTGIEIPGETKGLVPSPQWKEEYKGERWFLGNTYHYAIGQGDLLATPLQVTMAIAAVANQGSYCQPHLVKERQNSCHDLGIKQANIDLVKQGMVEACSSEGTGFSFFDYQPRVVCKTGTAEVGDGSDQAHAWFTLFAPANDPKITLTVFIERGGSGAHEAGPIAKQIVDKLKQRGYLN
jgi:penicillin-binding protein 2